MAAPGEFGACAAVSAADWINRRDSCNYERRDKRNEPHRVEYAPSLLNVGSLRGIVNNPRMAKSSRAAPAYDRLSHPLVREHGELHPASWSEALDRAAAGFRRNIDANGPNALGIFSCSKSTNEVNFLAQKIARVAFGTNNIDSCNRT
jgi:hypothetical protein